MRGAASLEGSLSAACLAIGGHQTSSSLGLVWVVEAHVIVRCPIRGSMSAFTTCRRYRRDWNGSDIVLTAVPSVPVGTKPSVTHCQSCQVLRIGIFLPPRHSGQQIYKLAFSPCRTVEFCSLASTPAARLLCCHRPSLPQISPVSFNHYSRSGSVFSIVNLETFSFFKKHSFELRNTSTASRSRPRIRSTASLKLSTPPASSRCLWGKLSSLDLLGQQRPTVCLEALSTRSPT